MGRRSSYSMSFLRTVLIIFALLLGWAALRTGGSSAQVAPQAVSNPQVVQPLAPKPLAANTAS